MRTTTFTAEDDGVAVDIDDAPDLSVLEEYDGKPLEQVESIDLREVPGALFQLVEIAAGGHFAMHSSSDIAFCQIVRGRGKLGLPDGRELGYEGPELYIFMPNTLHDWHDIEEDTLLSVCIVEQG